MALIAQTCGIGLVIRMRIMGRRGADGQLEHTGAVHWSAVADSEWRSAGFGSDQ